ncbi:enoyl-CoA hydratase [Rhodococcus zopfii]|uniref:enoyl-CoA hydratase n=1 Tax=Rhodococcus zopfii TaxID=43772 RepID=UPI001111190D|nr:enoyl-CoA hydratase [Rhodococcus zopfii]
MTGGGEATVQGLRSELSDGVLWLTIDRPKRMNAVDLATTNALREAVDAAGENPDVRTVVITGAGAAFCTGADLAAGAENPVDPAVTMDTANALIRSIATVPVPVIAAVNGPAAGFGVSIAIAADFTYAAESAYFFLSFVNVGLMVDGGSSLLVPAAIGRARAAEMALLGNRVSAADADRFGLVAKTLPDDQLLEHVRTVAARTATGPRRALALTKQALNASTLGALDEALEREKAGQAELLTSADFFEGATAMLQKRPPRFT